MYWFNGVVVCGADCRFGVSVYWRFGVFSLGPLLNCWCSGCLDGLDRCMGVLVHRWIGVLDVSMVGRDGALVHCCVVVLGVFGGLVDWRIGVLVSWRLGVWLFGWHMCIGGLVDWLDWCRGVLVFLVDWRLVELGVV